MLQRGGGNAVETLDVLLEVRRRRAGHRRGHLLNLVLPLEPGPAGRPEHRGDERDEQHADRRRQLTADRLTLEELQRDQRILAQEQRVGDAGFSRIRGRAARSCRSVRTAAVGQRVVAAVGQRVVQAELQAAADDLGLGRDR